MTNASESLYYDPDPLSHSMNPPPPPLQRRSAPSPEIPGAVLRTNNMDESMKIGSPWPSIDNDSDDAEQPPCYDTNSDRSPYRDMDSDATVGLASDSQANSMKNSSSVLGPFQQRAISPPSSSAYGVEYGNPNYTDLLSPQLTNALDSRLEAMRARNAEENYHWRIPPKDAPQHLQMMVLLYQWAAWALEITDQKRREEMLKWVNARTLEFMMSGGRIPGYNLKELLEIAGIDPRELYQNEARQVQQGRSLTEMGSSQLAARISAEQPMADLTGLKAEAKQSSREELDQDDEALAATPLASPSGGGKRHAIPDDGEVGIEHTGEIDHTRSDIEEHDEPFPFSASAIAYEGPSDRKREAVSEVEHLSQNTKRQKIDAESTEQNPFPTDEQNYSDSVMSPQPTDTAFPLSQVEAPREKYRQTFFKAQLNALLKNHRQSQTKKTFTSWSELRARLSNSRLSTKTIELLRDDFDNGWKTWDGSAFSTLPEYLQRTSGDQKSKSNGESASAPLPKKASAAPTSVATARARTKAKGQQKIKLNPGAGARAKDEDYDSEDGEQTAKRTSVTTRQQASQRGALKGKRGVA